jgi:hypothetical protein
MHGYIQNQRRPDADPVPGLPLAGDGFPELWTRGADVLARLGAAPEYLEGAYLDESNFMEGRSQALLAREIVIDDGPGRVAAPLFVRSRSCSPFMSRGSRQVNRIGRRGIR